ncbi:VOC family protein [Amycolatopsis sp. NPDC059027]|uniref:VOC family protein n=1 Tax=Amycolatopsis sp. NPDC059027 TaxID=3346709 RepID=UPI00366BF7EE
MTSAVHVTPGSPCWMELATSDPERSMRFYQALFGWDYRLLRDGAGQDYPVAVLAGEPVAGIRVQRQVVRDWTPYLAAPDLAGTAYQVSELGGTLLETHPHVVPGVGAKALADDPGGATVGLASPAADWAFVAGEPGTLVWLEFVTHRAHQADRFYQRLFGYEQRQFGDGRDVDYMVYTANGDSVLGRVRMAPGTPDDVPPRWIAHFAVDPDHGFDHTLHQARSLGAKLRFRPYTSALGKVAVLSDPLGTRFAIIDPALASDWDFRSAADDPYDD